MEKSTIKRLLKDKQITQQDAANYISCNPQTFNRWLNNRAQINADQLIKLFKLLGLQVVQVIFNMLLIVGYNSPLFFVLLSLCCCFVLV